MIAVCNVLIRWWLAVFCDSVIIAWLLVFGRAGGLLHGIVVRVLAFIVLLGDFRRTAALFDGRVTLKGSTV